MPSPSNYDENTMLELLSQGSEYAFTELFSRYRTKVYSVAFRFLRSQAAAEEVVQDVFLKCWLKRETLPEVKNLDAYLKVVTRNLVLNRFRKRANEAAAQEELGRREVMVNDTDHRIQEHQYREIIQTALGQLPPQQREVYRLAKEEGLSHEAIASRMHISAVTVKSHMARALQSIRRYLNGSISILLMITLVK
ncbi:RNA polymerase sigma-70 factor (family 1) [Chitinophaga sp. W2I13]|uniref:RNA polymerase sigma factor n=1 Tax=Chitinophaga sp. W2I13 TaxID=3373923 RepID=UPI003D1CF113